MCLASWSNPLLANIIQSHITKKKKEGFAIKQIMFYCKNAAQLVIMKPASYTDLTAGHNWKCIWNKYEKRPFLKSSWTLVLVSLEICWHYWFNGFFKVMSQVIIRHVFLSNIVFNLTLCNNKEFSLICKRFTPYFQSGRETVTGTEVMQCSSVVMRSILSVSAACCRSPQDPLFTVHHACLCFWFSFSFVEKLWMSYSQYSEHRGTSSCCYITHNLYSFSVILFKVHSILVQFLIPLVC